jgi:hypothetical protein
MNEQEQVAEQSQGEPTEEELQAAHAVLARGQAAQMRACMEEINEVLNRYGMDLHVPSPQVMLTPRR